MKQVVVVISKFNKELMTKLSQYSDVLTVGDDDQIESLLLPINMNIDWDDLKTINGDAVIELGLLDDDGVEDSAELTGLLRRFLKLDGTIHLADFTESTIKDFMEKNQTMIDLLTGESVSGVEKTDTDEMGGSGTDGASDDKPTFELGDLEGADPVTTLTTKEHQINDPYLVLATTLFDQYQRQHLPRIGKQLADRMENEIVSSNLKLQQTADEIIQKISDGLHDLNLANQLNLDSLMCDYNDVVAQESQRLMRVADHVQSDLNEEQKNQKRAETAENKALKQQVANLRQQISDMQHQEATRAVNSKSREQDLKNDLDKKQREVDDVKVKLSEKEDQLRQMTMTLDGEKDKYKQLEAKVATMVANGDTVPANSNSSSNLSSNKYLKWGVIGGGIALLVLVITVIVSLVMVNNNVKRQQEQQRVEYVQPQQQQPTQDKEQSAQTKGTNQK